MIYYSTYLQKPKVDFYLKKKNYLFFYGFYFSKMCVKFL